MNTNFKNRLDPHKKYDNIDGTVEMLLGLMVLAFLLVDYLSSLLPKDSIWKTSFFCGLIFPFTILIPVMATVYWIRRIIKRRITFPRTGYVARRSHWRPMFTNRDGEKVEPGLPAKKMRLLIIFLYPLIGIVAGAAMIFLLALEWRYRDDLIFLPPMRFFVYTGFWVGLYAFFIWQFRGEHRWKLLILLVMVLVLITIGFLGQGDIDRMVRPIMLFVGAVWFISGFITMVLYIIHTPPPTQEVQ